MCHLWGNTGHFYQTSSNIYFLSIAKWFVQINLTRFHFSLSLIGSDSHIPCLHYTEISNLILAPVKRLLDFQPSFFKARSNQDFSLRTPDLRDHRSPSPWPQWQEGMDFQLRGMNKANAAAAVARKKPNIHGGFSCLAASGMKILYLSMSPPPQAYSTVWTVALILHSLRMQEKNHLKRSTGPLAPGGLVSSLKLRSSARGLGCFRVLAVLKRSFYLLDCLWALCAHPPPWSGVGDPSFYPSCTQNLSLSSPLLGAGTMSW